MIYSSEFTRDRRARSAPAAAVCRANRTVLLVVCLPVLFALFAAAVGRVGEIVAALQRPAADRQRVGRFTREEAARRACYLVARVSGAPAGTVAAVDVEVYTNAGKRGLIPGSDEWDVSCRTTAARARGGTDYVVRLAADTGEPIVVRTPSDAAGVAPTPDTGEGDLRGRGGAGISRREAALWARRYLRLVGLPLPGGARLVRDRGYDFTFQCDGVAPDGVARMLRVRVSPKDGSLVHLQNVAYRKFGPLSLEREGTPGKDHGKRHDLPAGER
jgi:hypothetical protein